MTTADCEYYYDHPPTGCASGGLSGLCDGLDIFRVGCSHHRHHGMCGSGSSGMCSYDCQHPQYHHDPVGVADPAVVRPPREFDSEPKANRVTVLAYGGLYKFVSDAVTGHTGTETPSVSPPRWHETIVVASSAPRKTVIDLTSMNSIARHIVDPTAQMPVPPPPLPVAADPAPGVAAPAAAPPAAPATIAVSFPSRRGFGAGAAGLLPTNDYQSAGFVNADFSTGTTDDFPNGLVQMVTVVNKSAHKVYVVVNDAPHHPHPVTAAAWTSRPLIQGVAPSAAVCPGTTRTFLHTPYGHQWSTL